MKIEIVTGQQISINNIAARIVSIHPEEPSLYTTIKFEYLEAPYEGIQKEIRITNQ